MPGQAIVVIGDNQWLVSVASTLVEVTTGLSGVASIPPGTGMLFDLGVDQSLVQIDMSRMLFPLDIVFINSVAGVVGVVSNVQPGESVTFQAVTTPGARYFLEVNEGEAEGIGLGDDVVINGNLQSAQLDIGSMLTYLMMFMVVVSMFRMVDRVLTPRPVLYGPRGERLLPQTKGTDKIEAFEGMLSDLAQRHNVSTTTIARILLGHDIRSIHDLPDQERLDTIIQEGLKEQRLPQTEKGRLTRGDVRVEVWEERDRLHIGIQDKDTGEYVIDWWDDEAREMFEQGFFKRGRDLEGSVLDYAEYIGILAAESRPQSLLPQTQPAGVDTGHLMSVMSKVTTNELDNVVSKLSFELPVAEGPAFWRDKSKKYNMEYLLRWARRNPQHAHKLVQRLEAIAEEKAAYPVKGPVAGTRYITWDEFTALPSYPLIASAVDYPHDYRRKCSPVTKDGYLSVDAIYNMSAWAGWKSSSLGERDRRISEAIQELRLVDIMRLNKGRRADQPALFPERMLPYAPQTRSSQIHELPDNLRSALEGGEITVVAKSGLIVTVNGIPVPEPRAYHAASIARYIADHFTAVESWEHEGGHTSLLQRRSPLIHFVGACKVSRGQCLTHNQPVGKKTKCPESPLTDEEWEAAYELAVVAFPDGQPNPWVNGWWPETREEAERTIAKYAESLEHAYQKFAAMQRAALDRYARSRDKAIHFYREYVMKEYERGKERVRSPVAAAPRLIGPRERREPPEGLRYFADSRDHIEESMRHNGLRPRLDGAFRQAIARVQGRK